jgi:hypothetical protein
MRLLQSAAAVILLLWPLAAQAIPPAERLQNLQRGINITGWFRYPVSAAPERLIDYVSDAALRDLRSAGFTFVRLPVQPEFIEADPARFALLVTVIRRLHTQSLAVVVDVHPTEWHLETSASDREALFSFWDRLATALQPLDPARTFPELLNEPVFSREPEEWRTLQTQLVKRLRERLPNHTLVLTGNDWSSTAGLLALVPGDDPNVVYDVHFYEPSELTSLAAYRPNMDRAALAHLPFPADPATCANLETHTDSATAALIHFYCSLGWDGGHVATGIAAAAEWGRRNHAAVLIGEFGASAALQGDARSSWLSAVRTACESYGLGWALWGYDDVMGFNLSRPPPRRALLDHTVMEALGLAPM